jgi:predicted transcriptional regulator
MAQRRLIQIDQSTGEVVDGMAMFVPNKKRNGFGSEWFAMCMNAAMEFASSNMTVSDHRVLWAMLAHLDFENAIAINQSDIAKKIGIHRVTVCESLKRLCELGIIVSSSDKPCSYRLNPEYAWRGSGKNHRAALQGTLRLRS